MFVFSNSWWFLMVLVCSLLWFLVVLDGSWSLVVDFGGFWWFLVVLNG